MKGQGDFKETLVEMKESKSKRYKSSLLNAQFTLSDNYALSISEYDISTLCFFPTVSWDDTTERIYIIEVFRNSLIE